MSLARSLALYLIPSVALAGATASAFKPEHKKGANFYNAQAAIDSDATSAWMVPGESPNRGEWIMIDVPKCGIDKIGGILGYAKDKESFTDYGRIKKVKIEVFNQDEDAGLTPGPTVTVDFADKMEWQVVDINPDMDVGKELFGGKVKITIVDIYDGQDYPNFALSEILLYLKEFDTDVTITPAGAEDSAHPIDAVKDGSVKTFWAGPTQGAAFTLTSSGGFGISSITFQNGTKDYARVKSVKVSANNKDLVQELPDTDKPQSVRVPSITGYTGGAFGDITFTVLETYPGNKNAGTLAISEMKAMATNFEGF